MTCSVSACDLLPLPSLVAASLEMPADLIDDVTKSVASLQVDRTIKQGSKLLHEAKAWLREHGDAQQDVRQGVNQHAQSNHRGDRIVVANLTSRGGGPRQMVYTSQTANQISRRVTPQVSVQKKVPPQVTNKRRGASTAPQVIHHASSKQVKGRAKLPQSAGLIRDKLSYNKLTLLQTERKIEKMLELRQRKAEAAKRDRENLTRIGNTEVTKKRLMIGSSQEGQEQVKVAEKPVRNLRSSVYAAQVSTPPLNFILPSTPQSLVHETTPTPSAPPTHRLGPIDTTSKKVTMTATSCTQVEEESRLQTQKLESIHIRRTLVVQPGPDVDITPQLLKIDPKNVHFSKVETKTVIPPSTAVAAVQTVTFVKKCRRTVSMQTDTIPEEEGEEGETVEDVCEVVSVREEPRRHATVGEGTVVTVSVAAVGVQTEGLHTRDEATETSFNIVTHAEVSTSPIRTTPDVPTTALSINARPETAQSMNTRPTAALPEETHFTDALLGATTTIEGPSLLNILPRSEIPSPEDLSSALSDLRLSPLPAAPIIPSLPTIPVLSRPPEPSVALELQAVLPRELPPPLQTFEGIPTLNDSQDFVLDAINPTLTSSDLLIMRPISPIAEINLESRVSEVAVIPPVEQTASADVGIVNNSSQNSPVDNIGRPSTSKTLPLAVPCVTQEATSLVATTSDHKSTNHLTPVFHIDTIATSDKPTPSTQTSKNTLGHLTLPLLHLSGTDKLTQTLRKSPSSFPPPSTQVLRVDEKSPEKLLRSNKDFVKNLHADDSILDTTATSLSLESDIATGLSEGEVVSEGLATNANGSPTLSEVSSGSLHSPNSSQVVSAVEVSSEVSKGPRRQLSVGEVPGGISAYQRSRVIYLASRVAPYLLESTGSYSDGEVSEGQVWPPPKPPKRHVTFTGSS